MRPLPAGCGVRNRFVSGAALPLLAAVVVSLPASAAAPAPAIGRRGMVVTAHPLASQAAITVLKRGGNAVDAAAAAAFAIGVVEPFSAGIGGGGFALVYERIKGRTRALDFRERAPLGAERNLYLDNRGQVIPDASTTGHRAVAVPGTVAGLAELVRAGGRLRLAEVMAPAIDLASRGFVVTQRFVDASSGRLRDLEADPGAADVFLKGGKPYQVGDLLVQRDLAETLLQIATGGDEVFYRGEIAEAIAADMADSGGLITARDLASFKPVWRDPLSGRYRGYTVVSMPLPSSGGLLLLEILGLLERDRTWQRDYRDARTLHFLIEAERRAYADRAERLGDPAFVKPPTGELLAPPRLDALYRAIDPARRTPSLGLATAAGGRAESAHTSHLIVVDGEGNAVSLTFTVNTPFGAAVVVPGTGILLNNEMDDFSAKPGVPNAYGMVGNDANAIAPAKIPLSSMAPTLVFRDGKLVLAAGSPGGSTIPTTVLQIVLNTLDYDMDVAAAVAAPRLHHQWLPDEVWCEPYALEPETRRALFARGHTLVVREPWGNAMAVRVLPDGRLAGAADPRGEGAAVGY
ncbi:MAG: gamma-glutamyltransferase [Deltaproteobacteria bacterium]|nr:gamma-glutamyltransferase [Deltaproteobacteria bacterium]